MQRRKLNPQFSEYVQDGQLICFGISEHLSEERLPEWTDKAISEFKTVSVEWLVFQVTYLCLLIFS